MELEERWTFCVVVWSVVFDEECHQHFTRQ